MCCQNDNGIFNRFLVAWLTSSPIKVCGVLCCCTKIPVPVSQTCRVVSFTSSPHNLACWISCRDISFDGFMFLLCVYSDQMSSKTKALTFLLELRSGYFYCGDIVEVTGLLVVGQLKWRTTRCKPLKYSLHTYKLLWILCNIRCRTAMKQMYSPRREASMKLNYASVASSFLFLLTVIHRVKTKYYLFDRCLVISLMRGAGEWLFLWVKNTWGITVCGACNICSTLHATLNDTQFLQSMICTLWIWHTFIPTWVLKKCLDHLWFTQCHR